MDLKIIEQKQMVERYLLGRLTPPEARFFEQVVRKSPHLAERMGLPQGAPANFHTGGGAVEGAMVRGRRVAAACLAVDQITVAVSPPMNGPALLGQNFLRRFEMVIDGREMTLRPRAAR